jgi:N-dimethylarginine dimethylaminohydrolase
MEKQYGGQSMFAQLRRVLVRRPDQSFVVQKPDEWHYTQIPDLTNARKEHDAFVGVLKNFGAEIIYHDKAQPEKADAIYVFDPVLLTNNGAVILKMGKALRRGEEGILAQKLASLGIPILARLTGKALAEGGDLLWINEKTLAIGIGFRTNLEGLRQLANILAKADISVVPVELPYYKGPDACLHLLSLISIIDSNVAVTYKPLLSVAFCQFIKEYGYHMIEVPEEEFLTMGPNILALKPGLCLMLEGNKKTQEKIEKAGCEVITYQGNDISLKAEGGPTCLTLPILRGK